MNPLIVALTLVLTIAVAMCFGVILGYAAIGIILRAMRRHPQPEPEHALATSEASSGV